MLASLEADRARVAELEAKILDLERSISELRAEQAIAQERLDSYRYPVLTLPNEIVSEIFTHFLPIYPLCAPLTGMFSPTCLTHICRKWRALAISSPILWRAVPLSAVDIPFDRKAHLCNVWLTRSRSCPISIGMEEDIRSLHEIPSAVVSHRTRWEYLKLRCVQSDLLSIEGQLPLLRHLDLSLRGLVEETPAVEISAFREAPILRTVILDYLAAARIILPWAQLTSLTLTSVYPEVCVPILQHTSHLLRCELILCTGNRDNLPDVVLPRLQTLALLEEAIEYIIGYLDTFIVPALRRLKIAERFLGQNPIESLSSFLSKSGCKPQKIWILAQRSGNRTVAEEAYRAAFPSIPEFSFDEREMFDEDHGHSDSSGVATF
ncbi:F-box domain-containing protein [Mycena venus]|uniref:F-box domain-containing protein n=1 Tax=Mycena venus TaxID=2733690 RepID=A0A8H6XKG1_9AGAR|nr:F-box domain-containing protein [Mycena venus]